MKWGNTSRISAGGYVRAELLSPSNQAIERGYCQATENERGIRYYIWHRVKTIKALETAGYKQAKNEAPPAKIGGPFAAEPSGEAGYKVISGDGTTAIWVLGEENARMVVAALNKEFGFSQRGMKPAERAEKESRPARCHHFGGGMGPVETKPLITGGDQG